MTAPVEASEAPGKPCARSRCTMTVPRREGESEARYVRRSYCSDTCRLKESKRLNSPNVAPPKTLDEPQYNARGAWRPSGWRDEPFGLAPGAAVAS